MDAQQTELSRQDSNKRPANADDRVGVEAEIEFLRMVIYGLGAALLLLSICFTLFIYKQNNLLIAQIDTQTRMLSQNEPVFESNRQRLGAMVQDLRTYAQTHSDIVPILVNHNLVRVQTQPAMTSVPSLPAPAAK